MAYDWEEIFKHKDEKELIDIYSEKSHLNYEAGIYDGLELKRRNFDFRKIETIHNTKLAKLQEDIKSYQELNFFETKYFKRLIFATLAFVVLMMFVYRNKEAIFSERLEHLNIWIYMIALPTTIITAKWSFNHFKKDKKKTIEQKARLLKMMEV